MTTNAQWDARERYLRQRAIARWRFDRALRLGYVIDPALPVEAERELTLRLLPFRRDRMTEHIVAVTPEQAASLTTCTPEERWLAARSAR